MSSKRLLPNGFTLMEMVVTIVLFGVIAAVGSQLISKLVPSYLLSAQTQQSLSPREAALWRLSEDFRRALLVDATTQNPLSVNCMMSMVLANGMSGNEVISHVVAYWWDGENLRMSNTAVSGIVLNGVQGKLANNCPFIYTSTGCKGRMCLNVVFDYPDPNKADVRIPISATLYSYVNGPFVSAITPGTGAVSTTIPVTVTGIFPGVAVSNVAFMSGAVPISWANVAVPDFYHITANISSVSPATVDVTVSTVHGESTLRGQFIIN